MKTTLNTVKKVGPVLDLFTLDAPEWRMSEIGRALGMPKSSAHALVTTLAEIGLLSTGEQGRYRLGWNLLSLSERMRGSHEFREHSLPVMQQLSDSLRETVLLAALDRTQVIYVERVDGRHPAARLAGVAVGARVPAHCTAVGKVLLAHRDPADVRALLSASALATFTERTIATVDTLEQELAVVRTQGHAFDLEEAVPEIACAAVPISDDEGTILAAMSVGLPAYRFPTDPGSIVSALKQAAADISARIATCSASESPCPNHPLFRL